MKTEELEGRLEAMLAARAAQLDVPEREWSELAEVQPQAIPPRRRFVPVAAAAALVALLTAGAVLVASDDGERVTTGGPAATGTTAPGTPAFVAETEQVLLHAAALTIDIVDPKAGRRSFSAPAPEVHSDPGMVNEYTTLELTWQEHGVEMRLYVYFTSDGTDWWSKEIRTYDGRAQGEWITYEGEFFRSKLGTPFTGDLDLQAEDHGVTGRLRLTGLSLEAFRRPDVCRAPTAPRAVAARKVQVDVGMPSGATADLLDTATCQVRNDGIDFRWVAEDPAVATVATEPAVDPSGHRVLVTGKAVGVTRVRVAAVRRTSGEVVAEGTAEVRVAPPSATGPAAATASPGTTP